MKSNPTITSSMSYAAMLAREAIQTEPVLRILSTIHYTTGSKPTRTFHVKFTMKNTVTGSVCKETFNGTLWTKEIPN